jgi:hypothetical protein
MVAAGWTEATEVIPLKKEARFPEVSTGSFPLPPPVWYPNLMPSRVPDFRMRVKTRTGQDKGIELSGDSDGLLIREHQIVRL